MHIALWAMQLLLAMFFGWHSYLKFALPPNLPLPLQWVYAMSPGLRLFVGAAELLAAVGLVLPGLTRIQPRLTLLAALGVMLIMVGAAVFHVQRGETVATNVVVFIVAALVVFGRWRLRPLPGAARRAGT